MFTAMIKKCLDSKPPPSSASANASDEESKSAVIKTEFLKKVSERVKDEAVIPTQKRSPSSFTEPDMPPHQLSEQEMMKNAIGKEEDYTLSVLLFTIFV